MSLAIGALFVLLLGLAGWWPMRRLAGEWGAGPFERAALALALGAAITGLLQLAVSAAGGPCTALVPAVAAALSLLLCRLAPGPAPATPPTHVAPLPGLLALLLALVAIASVGAAVGTPFSADGIRIWSAKARDLALDGATSAPSLHDPDRFGVHRNYPLLVPALLAPSFRWAGPEAAAGPKLVLAALNLALLGVVSGLLRRAGPRGLAALAAFAALPFLCSLEVRESAVAGGYADSADALFLLLVVAGLQRLGTDERPGRAAALVALGGGALVSTKLEGGVELLVAVVAALLAGLPRARVLPAAALAVLLAAPTFLIQAGVSGDEAAFDPAGLLDRSVLAARALPVASGLAGLAIDASSFALLPLLLLAWLLPAAPATQARTRALALWMLAGALLFLAAAYLTTGMIPGRHIYTSAHRLAWHWLPALAVLAAQLAPALSPVAVPARSARG